MVFFPVPVVWELFGTCSIVFELPLSTGFIADLWAAISDSFLGLVPRSLSCVQGVLFCSCYLGQFFGIIVCEVSLSTGLFAVSAISIVLWDNRL